MINTDTEVLKNFVEIIENGSITAASKKLYVTQATLSMQLKNLEKELGAVLLIRSAHGLSLTESGKILYRRAKSITAAAASMKNEISEAENGETGRVRLGLLSEEGISLASEIIRGFSEKFKSVRFEFYEGSERELTELIGAGAAGAAVLRTPCTLSSDMNIIRIKSEKAAAVYFDGEYPAEADISVLSSGKIAVMRKYLGVYRRLFSEKAKKNKQFISPEISVIADSAETVIKSAGYAAAFGLVPLSAARFCGEKHIILSEDVLCTERIIVSAGGNKQSAAERLFIDYVSSLSKQSSQMSAPL